MPASEPLTSSGGPRRSGQQLFTKLSCSAIFFICSKGVPAAHLKGPDHSTSLSSQQMSSRHHLAPGQTAFSVFMHVLTSQCYILKLLSAAIWACALTDHQITAAAFFLALRVAGALVVVSRVSGAPARR